MTYQKDVHMPAKLFRDINKRLTMPNFEDMTEEEFDKSGAEKHVTYGIFEVPFADGSRMTYDLCSSSSNYYDNIVFYNHAGYPETVECDFELGNEIEIDNEGNTYIANIILD